MLFDIYYSPIFAVAIETEFVMFQACVELSKKVGQMRTETELLPQCWEQVCVTITSSDGYYYCS